MKVYGLMVSATQLADDHAMVVNSNTGIQRRVNALSNTTVRRLV